MTEELTDHLVAATPTRRSKLLRTLADLGPAAPYALLVTVVPVAGNFVLLSLVMAHGEWLREHRVSTAALVSVGYALVGGLALLPSYSVAVLSGWAIGFQYGFPAVWLGIVLAAGVGYFTGRGVTRDRVMKLIDRSPRLAVLHAALLAGGFWRTTLIVFLWRLSPAVPFSTSNMLLAATKVAAVPYLVGSAVGVMPRTIVLTYAASSMARLDFSAAESWWMLVVGAVVTVLVIAIISIVARRAMRHVTGSDIIGRVT